MGMLDKAKKSLKKKKEATPAPVPEPIPDKGSGGHEIDPTAPIADTIRETMGAGNTSPEKKKPGEHRDYLMWVGSGDVGDGHKGFPGYPTIESFVKEARRMGVSKRLNMVTPHLIPGKTRIYLAHPSLYEIAARFLDRDATVNGESVPKISRIKAIRKVGNIVRTGVSVPYKIMRQATPVANNDRTFSRILYGFVRNYKGVMDPWEEAIRDASLRFVEALDNERAVFGFFTIQRLEYILPAGWTNDQIPPKVKELIDKGVCVVVREEDERRLAVQPRG
jgi:hypothetical protein